jgi:fluoroacetyl-CoA thioesterase
MKDGIKIGQTAMFECVVTPEMFAQFEGQIVHPAYSTASMVHHMEFTSRKLILPYLENDEEGMGAAVNLKHIAPAVENNKIKFTAKITKIENNMVYAEVEARNEERLIGKGSVLQVILPKEEITRKLENGKR